MLQIDLTRTDKDICKFISDQCKRFGDVKSVNIYRSPTTYAVVRMIDRSDASAVAKKMGKATFDGAVVIPLKRK
jgi:hypothetical protein